MNEFLGCELDGSIVEVTLAKPVDKNQYFRFTRGVSPSALATNLPVMIFFSSKRKELSFCSSSRFQHRLRDLILRLFLT